MPSLNSSIELIAKSNRRRILLEAATLNRQRRDAATKKGYVGHASTSAVTGGSRHRASDGSDHVTMFSRRDDSGSSGGVSNLAKLIARNLGGASGASGGSSSSRS